MVFYRFQLKTQFDKNVVTHFEVQEQVCDYIFSHLGIDSEGRVPHPIVMTEAFVTPNYSRQCKDIIISLSTLIIIPVILRLLLPSYGNIPKIPKNLKLHYVCPTRV